MTTQEIRKIFLDFFKEKQHTIVQSAPLPQKEDPSLLFVNAGMNPFKDIFLGAKSPEHKRVANFQACLRVSGKHNDLEEVGRDHYHHTLFEMLGNWSFGDYFKQEAIDWAYELLVGRLGLDPSRMYATIFEGDKNDSTPLDKEAQTLWMKHLPEEHILKGNKKDNFWEMGSTGPCGPCSELHYDMRSDEARATQDGASLVNADHEEVIEIWNLVFMQYQRDAKGALHPLPERHVDTGMGLERLVRAIQKKGSNYDTDVFSGLIARLEKISGKQYGASNEADIAFRVIADHIRALVCCISDGLIPGNNGGAYVLKRILRRALRYGYTYLDLKSPFLFELVDVVGEELGDFYPSISSNIEFVTSIIREEEQSFLRTLSKGIARLESHLEEGSNSSTVSGKVVFELYDTFGFPVDLTELVAREQGWSIDMKGFEDHMSVQKLKSSSAAKQEKGDWEVLSEGDSSFVGYDTLEVETEILAFRLVETDKEKWYELKLSKTPFYPEGGGQVGDTGWLTEGENRIEIFSTKKENDTIIHSTKDNPSKAFQVMAHVDKAKRKESSRHHTATHLLHHVLREVLGSHVEQRGSLVHSAGLRFDFSHFEKIDTSTLKQIETKVQEMIDQSLDLQEERSTSIEEAKKKGAMALFGEKYGNTVRTIQFGDSIELCGGTHVSNTQDVITCCITSESSVASGVRRIEAIVGSAGIAYLQGMREEILTLQQTVLHKDVVKRVENILAEKKQQEQQIEHLRKELLSLKQSSVEENIEKVGEVNTLVISAEMSAKDAKQLCFDLEKRFSPFVGVVLSYQSDKIQCSAICSKSLNARGFSVKNILKGVGPLIRGGGGGQDFFASGGGQNVAGKDEAVAWVKEYLVQEL